MRREPQTSWNWRPVKWGARLLAASAVGLSFGVGLRQLTQPPPVVDLSTTNNEPTGAPSPVLPQVPGRPTDALAFCSNAATSVEQFVLATAPAPGGASAAEVRDSATAVGLGASRPPLPLWDFPRALRTAIGDGFTATGLAAAQANAIELGATAQRMTGTTVSEGTTRAVAEILAEIRARDARPPKPAAVTVAPPPRPARTAPLFPPVPDPLKGTELRKND